MAEKEFAAFLSGVSSRLRHDLKGGLLTLKMGLESLDDEEMLKPLLMEKAEELVNLSDKLVLLLRMGEILPQSVNPKGLFRQAAKQAQELYAPLKVEVNSTDELASWHIDADAVVYAFNEIAQNALLAKAETLRVDLSEADGRGLVKLCDDGQGLPNDKKQTADLLELGTSGWSRSGLGLSVVNRCLLQHGGDFCIDSTDGGTCCTLQFDLVES